MNSAYLGAVFEATEDTPEQFAIITAYNQHGRLSPESRNRHQDMTLKAVLEGKGLNTVRVTGRDEHNTHREPGWAVELPLSEALKLGRLFKQEAIYYVQNGQLSLHMCDTGETVKLGLWSDRLQ